MTIDTYIENLDKRYRLGNATEHTFRGDLQQLLESLTPSISATNEPKRQKCGAPDYILTKKDIPVGFIEAKDIGEKDLDGSKKTGNKEQFDRYKASLNNLIFTDYIHFHLYREGEFTTKIAIGEITDKGIQPLPENFAAFENLIRDFSSHVGQTIKSSKKLAEMMAGKARLLSDIIGNALTSDEENQEDSTLKDQMKAFKQILIHDITPKGFADVYAQTIAYGMFAARLHDPTLGTFSRQEAAELIPKSNPFLRKLFGYIAGPDIDDRIKWIVDSLADIFLACNVEEILKNYGKSTKMEDPIIHFYETFLSEYDPKLRKSRGVWYTPQPVVEFIVRAVDDILKTEFDLPDGLANTSTTRIKVNTQTEDRRSATGYKQVEQEVHRVQILDPATGTGTFLAEVVKHIHKQFAGQEGIWSNYAERHLIPRLNGFELLMASYAMAHLKLDLLLTETGYKPTSNQRLRVYLTNSLEEHHQDTGTLFASWLSAEANDANHVKRDTPVMCVIGNPPYSGESANKGKWIMGLMDDYKKEPGGKIKLKEQNSKFINDDYVKFIRYGQHFIEKNGSGLLAFINPHGFLDNPTFRGMRWNLLKTYDKIFTIDLHGNSKKNETTPDGSLDSNVFDIMQGVSINIFIKNGAKKPNELGKVFHFDLFGTRNFKYDFLNQKSLKNIDFNALPNIGPNFFMVKKDFAEIEAYNQGFSLNEIYEINSLGLLTKKDNFITSFDKKFIEKKLQEFLNNSITNEQLSSRFNLKLKDNDKWDLDKARKNLQKNGISQGKFLKQNYRCFDERWIYYDGDFVARLNTKVLSNVSEESLAIISTRQLAGNDFHHVFISKIISDQCFISNKTKEGCQVFPLYLHIDGHGQQAIDESGNRKPNLNIQVVRKIENLTGLSFTTEKETTEKTFAPIDILDYVYAVLHSPSYRQKYKEFLKIDFPRVPYPKHPETFWQLVNLGEEIRQIHLLESPTVNHYITRYPIDGSNEVVKPRLVPDAEGDNGKVYINDTQYFNGVPVLAWKFYIGGYQPAQKWLKDRKGRCLEYDDILHYQKIIVALTETDRLMKEVDKISI
ncbi:type ISP restriction/modification enzyme [Cyclobacterium jeungdonense]|uniref:site-specific DNA-methyltransferase (adenine-specific) n=1 Tax=Cyclobacterium jeungdonense TaxID=708087 RepID=A0ABT8CAB1_9BACT|nr:type ISP restriction/modification enzyme [Cyclobacterium jeungdonense]MDN3688710.1 N-6 DNA methylase [Cyclobacterium jeungdonense]